MDRRLAAVLAVGLLIRLPLVPVDTGRTTDVRTYASWAEETRRRGLEAIYDVPSVDYPPLLLVLFRAAAAVARRAPEPYRARVLVAGVKAWPVLADVATAWLLACVARRRGSVTAWRAAALYVFNPAVWYVSAFWGQTDSVVALLMALSVVALSESALARGCLASACAVLTKLQAVSLVPLAAAVTARAGWRALARAVALTAAGLCVLLLPWIAAGRVGDVWNVLTRVVSSGPSEWPLVNVTGFNLWYLFVGTEVIDSRLHPAGLPVSYRALGIAMYAAFVVVVAGRAVRLGRPNDRSGVAIGAAALAAGMQVFLTQVHERYLFPALALLLLSALYEDGPAGSSLRRLYVALSVGLLLNLVVIAPFTPLLGINLWAAPPSPRTSVLRALGYLVALLNLGAALWLAARSASRPRARLAPGYTPSDIGNWRRR